MAKSHTQMLNVVAMILLAVLTAGFISLGNWQLSRANERRVIAEAIERGRSREAVNLDATTDDKDLLPWRPAKAEGIWLNKYSLLLDNRNLEGKPGLWLATPLKLEDGRALLVLRGWLARPLSTLPGNMQTPMKNFQAPPGMQKVSGEISLRVPRLYELWSPIARPEKGLPDNWPIGGDEKSPATTETLLRVQNLDVNELSHRTGLRFLPVVLMQLDEVDDGLTRVWPGPSVDSDKNIGYAIQWFGFAAIAGLVLLGLIYKTLRKQKTAK